MSILMILKIIMLIMGIFLLLFLLLIIKNSAVLFPGFILIRVFKKNGKIK